MGMSAQNDQNFILIVLQNSSEFFRKVFLPKCLILSRIKLPWEDMEVDDDLSFIWHILNLILEPSHLFFPLVERQFNLLDCPHEGVKIQECNSMIVDSIISSLEESLFNWIKIYLMICLVIGYKLFEEKSIVIVSKLFCCWELVMILPVIVSKSWEN